MVELKVKKLKEAAILPVKATDGSVCYDVFVSEDVIVLPRTACERAYLVPTGLQITPPKGYGLKVHLRSSTGRNTGLRLANQTGIIDTDYQGEIFICLENFSKLPEVIKAGDRVAQLEVIAIIDSKVTEVKETPKATTRGKGGFGSTGKTQIKTTTEGDGE